MPPPSERERAAAAAYRQACLDELDALKPGNVHRHADGHGMTVAQFVAAAEASAAVIARPGLSVGQRIEAAVEASWAATGCNTNLGIVLLAAPLLQAVLEPGLAGGLPARVTTVLGRLTREDAEHAFRAIRRANPGGLGRAEAHDVAEAARVTLLEAMQAARDRDRIAAQYAEGFRDVFAIGVPRLRALRPADPVAAVEAAYLDFLTAFPDSHLARKFGSAAAEALRAEAADLAAAIDWRGPLADRRARLADFDASLKARGLNPGTSADLTVASLLAEALENVIDYP